MSVVNKSRNNSGEAGPAPALQKQILKDKIKNISPSNTRIVTFVNLKFIEGREFTDENKKYKFKILKVEVDTPEVLLNKKPKLTYEIIKTDMLRNKKQTKTIDIPLFLHITTKFNNKDIEIYPRQGQIKLEKNITHFILKIDNQEIKLKLV